MRFDLSQARVMRRPIRQFGLKKLTIGPADPFGQRLLPTCIRDSSRCIAGA
jgi:hypothetical protein